MSFSVIQPGQGETRDVVLCYHVGSFGKNIAEQLGPSFCVVAETSSAYNQLGGGGVTPWKEALAAVGAGEAFRTGRIWLIGFSAGCQGVRSQLNAGCPASVVLACDGIHGNKPVPSEAQSAAWKGLASSARMGQAIFSVSCSKTAAYKFLSTEETARVLFGWTPCFGSYSSPCVDKTGSFRIYGATNSGGNPADEHMDQLRKLLPIMIQDAMSSGTEWGWWALGAAAVAAIAWALTSSP